VRHSGMLNVPVKQSASAGVRRVRSRRDFAAMRERRMLAADMFEQGVIPAEVARQVGVSHQIVSDWRNAWRRSGRDGLRGAGRAGRLPKMSREQLVQVERELLKGAEANGYPNDVWTLQRVAEVIERHRRVLSPGTRLVHLAPRPTVELATTGTPSQRAQRRGYPSVGKEALATFEKRARRQNALIVFEDESGVSLLPSVRATWAPRGHTPVLRHPFNWKRLSLAGALAYEPRWQ
jgi:transposase